uniref:Endonuclease/exonuclease/phosphatase family protein n=1 Tax=Roseihalotalea indica TaxID=2867963 RepID=A0AA49GUC8_9BACT|nr:endonuclease/exonuclease/phosphatase family protein [Tunicatimonas sp. TK19036]
MKQKVGVVLYLSTALIFVLPPESYFHDILQSFAVQAMIGYLLIGLLAALFHRMVTTGASLSAALLIACGLYMAQSFNVGSTANIKAYEGDTIVRVAHFNVLCNNSQFKKTISSALATKADLLSFQEVTAQWGEELEKRLSEEYPYSHIVTYEQEPGRGLAVFSRYPLENLQTIYWEGLPNIAGDLQLQDKTIHFLASHTLSPRSRWRYRQRNEHIRQIARYIKTVDDPVLAIGDFNVVPWNPVIQELRATTHLQDSHTGWAPTFPARLQSIGIPIDYIFHSRDFYCKKFEALPSFGSDHRGVVGEYLLKSKG